MAFTEVVLYAPDEAVQMQVGKQLAEAVKAPLTLYLQGDLGAGKTTLVRGFLRALGHQGAVRSPTYTLMEPYAELIPACYHFDLYRLCDPGELEYLGVRDLLGSPVVLLFEWPERAVGELPTADVLICISTQDTGRQVHVQAQTEQGQSMCNCLEKSKGS